MKKILAFAGSNSSTSINHIFVTHVADRIQGHEVKLLELRPLEIPMYSIDIEKNRGFPTDVLVLKNLIDDHDAPIISVNEHNSAPSALFKDRLGCLSRLDRSFPTGNMILLMSAGPGTRGGAAALEFCNGVFPRFIGKVLDGLSLAAFGQNFVDGGVVEDVLQVGV